MRRNRVIFSGIFMFVYGLITYYLGLQGWNWLRGLGQVGAPGAWIYWLAVFFAAAAFPLSRFVIGRWPVGVVSLLARVGAYWLLVLMYGLPLLLLVEVAGLFLPGAVTVAATGVVLALVALAAVYGGWRARRPVVVRHEVEIAKPGGKHQELHVVLVSDTHLGLINGPREARQMVEMVNSLKPDLILHGGDLIDDDVRPFMAHRMADELKRLQAPLGTYVIMGNHDFGEEHPGQYRRELEQAGIRLLIDEWVKVDESFTIIGRDDLSGRWRTGRERMPLSELMEGVDKELPLILMDHQPSRLAEAEQAGIDLMVSGHTHRGQMFPNHLVTRRVFEVDWGYMKRGTMHVIVSLGFGTWGPPVRIGNSPEVVSIRVRFRT
ncbi:MAG TPA: metallophosphoesterase [Symbiobacteriaceae bacterium]|nr:metallophosphoesterase [Symbiobacteriaceae bacterium]